MDPVPKRLALHPAGLGRRLAVGTLQNQRDRQHPPRRLRIMASGCASTKIARCKLPQCDRNHHPNLHPLMEVNHNLQHVGTPKRVRHIARWYKQVPSVSVSYARNGNSTKSNELGMRAMQERAYEKRGEQYLLIKSPPASGKSRALMFIALDKLHNQGLRQAIVVVPEKSIGASFNDEPLSQFGFWADWTVTPKWNLCNSPGTDGGKVKSVGAFLASGDPVLVCTHATFRFAVEKLGIEAFDDRLIAVDEFHHVSASEDSILGTQLNAFITRDRVHIVAMTGSYFRGDAVPILLPENEARFETVTYTYYEQLNGYTALTPKSEIFRV
jgi:superfamily II DNA or RNA helicase